MYSLIYPNCFTQDESSSDRVITGMSISSDRNPQIGNLPGSLNIPEDLDDLHFDQFGISPEDLDHGMHICKGCPDGNDRYAEIVHLEE